MSLTVDGEFYHLGAGSLDRVVGPAALSRGCPVLWRSVLKALTALARRIEQ